MQIENTDVYGFDMAIRGMRNPLNSLDKKDSRYTSGVYDDSFYWCDSNANAEGFILGESDKQLSQKLVKAGDSHGKHLRLIQVWADFTLPRFIWQEFDTYRHIEKVSCSTMHTLMKNTITEDMFEGGFLHMSADTIHKLNELIQLYKCADDLQEKKQYKYHAKRILPESFLQKRTINTNYQCLLNIYKQRKNHELPQWQEICQWILALPYFKELTGIEGEK